MTPTHIDLFSGIGGFTLACEWNGIETEVFCEKDERCRGFLQRTYPGVPIVDDVKKVDEIVSLCYAQPEMEEHIMKNYQEAVKMYESGLSIQNAADYYGITRQAMWKILQRRGVVFRPQLKHGEDNHFYRGGRTWDKRAEHLVEQAVKKGVIVRKPCEVCNSENSQAHHDDYNKPMEVRWLCKKDHFEWHKKNKAKEVIAGNIRNKENCFLLTAGVPC